MLKKICLLSSFLSMLAIPTFAYDREKIIEKMVVLPLSCIPQEFPNKTSHLADNYYDATLLPHELHPVFYGCLDWHSSVHAHWSLLSMLEQVPHLSERTRIIEQFNRSFQQVLMEQEATYFGKYTSSETFERTYGWAWLLKLDEALLQSTIPEAKAWRKNMSPLTEKIVSLWKRYLPTLTYANRTGVHSNTAFGMIFAMQWAKATGQQEFYNELAIKAKELFEKDKNYPGYLEPSGTDLFSPALMEAELMTYVLTPDVYNKWFNNFLDNKSLEQLYKIPYVSNRKDYYIVHLDGLAFSRSWNLKKIADYLPNSNPRKKRMLQESRKMLETTIPQVFSGNYGGDHWLASFALYSMNANL